MMAAPDSTMSAVVALTTIAVAESAAVVRVKDVSIPSLRALLKRVQLAVIEVAPLAAIPGSYWGDSEAGLQGNRLYVRCDTPLHSVLHEACHYICMDSVRRSTLDREAGGDFAEENAVCYLQILLAEHVTDFGRKRMFADMDAWGYTFRLGSARAWFEAESDDARNWLLQAALIDADGQPTWRLRV